MRVHAMLNSTILACAAAVGLGACHEPGTGPSQAITLNIEGTVEAGAGATVVLFELRRPLDYGTDIGEAKTDSGGHYVLVSSSPCVPANKYWYFLDVWDGDRSYSTRTALWRASFNPEIRCTSTTQVINFPH